MTKRNRSVLSVLPTILILIILMANEDNLRSVTYQRKKICAPRRARYRARWAPRVNSGARFFYVPDRARRTVLRAQYFGRVEIILGGLRGHQ